MSLNIIPYDKIRHVIINVKKEELVDIPHSARLQYRLLTNDAIIKAKVNYQKGTIEIYYNPEEKENKSQLKKISLNKILEILEENNVHAKADDAKGEVVDYKETLFKEAYNPKEIKHIKPYGW
ncbi:MAG: hypothetical protein ACP5RT_01210 [Candidatus Micrarchaeia archaeon]